MVKKVRIKNEDISRLEIFAFLNDTTIEKLLKEAISHYVSQQEKSLLENFNKDQKENYAYLLLMKQTDRNSHFFKDRVDSLRLDNEQ